MFREPKEEDGFPDKRLDDAFSNVEERDALHDCTRSLSNKKNAISPL